MSEQTYVSKPGGLKTQQKAGQTGRLKQMPDGEVVKDERIPVPVEEKKADAIPVQAPRARDMALQPATARICRWAFKAQHGITPADLERPDFWAACVHKLARRPGDLRTEITVEAEDGTFWGEMIVEETGVAWAKCRFKDPPMVFSKTFADVQFRDHTIGFAGGSWRVVRDADSSVLQEGFVTANSALAWLDDHLRAMAA